MKIGFVIYTKKHPSSFIRTEIIDALNRQGELHFLEINESISEKQRPDLRIKEFTQIPKLLKKVSVFQQSVNLWKYKDRTISHTVRAYNTFGNTKQRSNWYSVIEYENTNWGSIRKTAVKLFSHQPFHSLLAAGIHFTRKFFFQGKLIDLIKEYDIILIPFGGHISAEFGNLIWLCRRLKIPVVALQENWDNLSSKTFIIDEPDYFAVWGRQSASHLKSIHRLQNCSIHEIGSPRFGAYSCDESAPPIASDPERGEIKLERPFILVAGTGDGLDDEMLIESTLMAVRNHPRGATVDVIYRPHPFTRRSNSIARLRKEYRNLILDSGFNAREPDHHVPLIKHAQVVINHFSTMTLEALIAKNLVIVPLYLGRPANYRYDRFLDEAQHYIGAGLVSNLFTPSNAGQLQELIKSLLSGELATTSRTDISWMCKKGRYGESLAALVQSAKKQQV